MPPDAVPRRAGCADRLRFGQAVVNATATMYAARRARDAAKNQQVRDHALIERLDVVLAAAERAAIEAQREFDQHVREHRCKA